GDSPYGCADMAGNVWDWTSSLYKEYPYRTDDGREDLTGSDSRVLRGGSFNSPVGRARVAFRLAKFTDFSDERRGCRVCATAPLNTEALNVAASPVPPSRPDALVAVPAKPPGLTWDIAVLRQLLNDAFDDPELDAFCLEQFPKVYDKFSRGMRKDEKITLLLDYGRRRPARRQKLLDALEEQMR
ncbi:MAG: SUMF1/EgtB/PvdO family nonheme iron enzyme, partial [Promethearchaeota archaeon]